MSFKQAKEIILNCMFVLVPIVIFILLVNLTGCATKGEIIGNNNRMVQLIQANDKRNKDMLLRLNEKVEDLSWLLKTHITDSNRQLDRKIEEAIDVKFK